MKRRTFQVVSRRYGQGSIILTTNRGIAERGAIFEDATVAAAFLDRLLRHCTVVSVEGESYRMRGHREKLGQLRAAVAERSVLSVITFGNFGDP